MEVVLSNFANFDSWISEVKHELANLSPENLRNLRPFLKNIAEGFKALSLIGRYAAGITPPLVMEMIAELTHGAITFCEFSEAQLRTLPTTLRKIMEFIQQAIETISEYKGLLFAGAGAAVLMSFFAPMSGLISEVCDLITKLASYSSVMFMVLTPMITAG